MNRKMMCALLMAIAVAMYAVEVRRLSAFGVDWTETYRPAVEALLAGDNPYQTVTTLHNPAWGLLPLVPFALMGEFGLTAFFFVAFGVYVWAAWRLNISPLGTIFIMTSPLMAYNLMLGNIDWLVVIGFTMPAWAGLFFVLLKPQIGICVAAAWAWQAHRRGGLPQVVKTFAPVTLALALSFVVYGNWLSERSDDLLNATWNAGIFPHGVIIGIVLLFVGRTIAASPFFSPYLSAGSWSVMQFGLPDKLNFAITCGLWLLYGLGQYG